MQPQTTRQTADIGVMGVDCLIRNNYKMSCDIDKFQTELSILKLQYRHKH